VFLQLEQSLRVLVPGFGGARDDVLWKIEEVALISRASLLPFFLYLLQ